MIKFKIVIPCYNCEQWIDTCIKSLQMQDYPHFNCVIVNDCSRDATETIASLTIGDDKRFSIFNKKTRSYPLKNTCDGISYLTPSPEDVIIVLDGDDWLATKDALSYLVDIYSHNTCWMTYGNTVSLATQKVFASLEYPEEVIKNNSYRDDQWRFQHLRTFKFHLWDRINQDDFLESDGCFFTTNGDMAFFFPLIEMASERAFAIERILHIYNDLHANTEGKLYPENQKRVSTLLRKKERYKRVACQEELLSGVK